MLAVSLRAQEAVSRSQTATVQFPERAPALARATFQSWQAWQQSSELATWRTRTTHESRSGHATPRRAQPGSSRRCTCTWHLCERLTPPVTTLTLRSAKRTAKKRGSGGRGERVCPQPELRAWHVDGPTHTCTRRRSGAPSQPWFTCVVDAIRLFFVVMCTRVAARGDRDRGWACGQKKARGVERLASTFGESLRARVGATPTQAFHNHFCTATSTTSTTTSSTTTTTHAPTTKPDTTTTTTR